MKINQEELKEIINSVKDAVDKSAFGPLFMYPDEINIAEKQVNQLAWTLYLHLITPLMKRYIDANKSETP